MRKIRKGDVFAFSLDAQKKYGLIQIIRKSYAGFNVRVFYDLIEDFSSATICKIIQGKQFYYLRNFYTPLLVNEPNNYLGNYSIPSHVVMPRYMRTSERKGNGELYWYVFDVVKNKLVKTYPSFDEQLRGLSPDDSWGIEYIKKRWEENFTLENWHDLENEWYLAYLQKYEPERLDKKFKKPSPTTLWKKTNRFSLNLICKVEEILTAFFHSVSEKNLSDKNLQDVLEQLITKLNILNKSNPFIETEEREEILEFIYYVLHTAGYDDNFNCIDRIRNW